MKAKSYLNVHKNNEIKKKILRRDWILEINFISTIYSILSSSSASLTFIVYHGSHKNHFLICHQQNLISSKTRFSNIPQKYLEREDETTRYAIKTQALYYSFWIFDTKTFIINKTQVSQKWRKDEIHILIVSQFLAPTNRA